METATMNISLPKSLKQFVKKRVGEKHYSNPSDYVRALIREDQARRDEERLEEMLVKGLSSGSPIPMTKKAWSKLRGEAKKRVQEV